MNINRNVNTFIPPFTVVLIDATDAYYYADIFDSMEKIATVNSFEVAKALADALFVVKNYGWTSLDEMNDVDGGYDARVYDSNHMTCVYAAHERYKKHWIGMEG